MSGMGLKTSVDIGALVKDRRKALSLTQAELAEQVGVKRLWIGELERGNDAASLGLILKTFMALNISLSADAEIAVDDEGPLIVGADLDALIEDFTHRGGHDD